MGEILTCRRLIPDADSLLNGAVAYRIVDGNTSLFHVGLLNGTISLIAPLDYESATWHTMIITAEDYGSPPLSANATVTVLVTDVNDNAPVLNNESYTLSLLENTTVGDVVMQVNATDPDTGNGGRISYRLLDADTQTASFVFAIDATGAIRLTSRLNRDGPSGVLRYDVVVVAQDNGVPRLQDTSPLVISVEDVNDNAPQWSVVPPGQRVTLLESAAIGAVVTTVRAVDADEPDTPNSEVSVIDVLGFIMCNVDLDSREYTVSPPYV